MIAFRREASRDFPWVLTISGRHEGERFRSSLAFASDENARAYLIEVANDREIRSLTGKIGKVTLL